MVLYSWMPDRTPIKMHQVNMNNRRDDYYTCIKKLSSQPQAAIHVQVYCFAPRRAALFLSRRTRSPLDEILLAISAISRTSS